MAHSTQTLCNFNPKMYLNYCVVQMYVHMHEHVRMCTVLTYVHAYVHVRVLHKCTYICTCNVCLLYKLYTVRVCMCSMCTVLTYIHIYIHTRVLQDIHTYVQFVPVDVCTYTKHLGF